ncbi:response regulator transcription factor [Photobacterium sp. CAU 1568]|uniref:Response regulator transcription factor n=1 Tax=Photobacterium arenosum TaxID=2774143 RepID=A0ABR9BN22_9GAMM|nr:response regulator transcription factor [Photobacterium arenosum]MBD8512856.1 response regulator transcription factor [Photobacterium arenosum]
MQWSPKPPIRIALLDDHALIREALSVRLSAEPDFNLQGVYSTSTQLLDAIRRETFDLLVLDYQLGDGELDGLRLIGLIRQRYPDLRIVIFSSAERPATVHMSIRTGANGFVGKSQNTDDLILAIRMAARGRLYLSPNIATELEKQPFSQSADDASPNKGEQGLLNYSELSPKESEVLRCCLAGLTVNQIAQKFSRSKKTISSQKQAAFRKLGIRTDAELFKLEAEISKTH